MSGLRRAVGGRREAMLAVAEVWAAIRHPWRARLHKEARSNCPGSSPSHHHPPHPYIFSPFLLLPYPLNCAYSFYNTRNSTLIAYSHSQLSFTMCGIFAYCNYLKDKVSRVSR